MEKIVCKKCGHLNDETQIFCANCEEVLSDSIHGKKYLEQQKKTQKAKRTRGKILCVMAILLLISCAVFWHLSEKEKVQGIWKGKEGVLFLEPNGEASIFNASFLEEGDYKWKFRPGNRLILVNVDTPTIKTEYKVKFDGEELELTETADNLNVYSFWAQSQYVFP